MIDTPTPPDSSSSSATEPDGRPPTWLERDHAISRRIARPMREFMEIEIAGGIVLVAATILALVLANTPVGDDIRSFWADPLTLFEFNDFHLRESVGHWVNDGLMVVFFFVVGLEIKRELVDGELRDPRRAALPVIAAVGGMVAPALLFTVFNVGGDGSKGWGVPMATDIAFAVGVLTLVGNRVPAALKVYLLTLAIADDIGAIIVIAVFYSSGMSFGWLLVAALLVGAIAWLRVMRVWYLPIYLVLGVCLWVAMLESGVHATIAGVILGLLTPARPLRPRKVAVEVAPQHTPWDSIRSTLFEAKETVSVAERLQHSLHPWSSFVILPIFAFANAGIELTADGLSDAVTSPVTLGVIVGLVAGKPIGIVAASFLAVRLRVGTLPRGVRWSHLLGAGALAGIGFTVAIFVTGLAFDDALLADEAKIGVLVASVIAATFGTVVMRRVTAGDAPHPDADDERSAIGSSPADVAADPA